MTEGGAKYRFQTVKVMRGLEARTIASRSKEGWELDSQVPGTLMTQLRFRRRARKPLPKAMIGAGALLAVCLVAAAVGAVRENNSTPRTAPHRAPATVTSATPTESASPEPAVLTVQNSPELAAVFAEDDYCDGRNGAFVAQHPGATIEFDGSVASVANVGQGASDILVTPGDAGSHSVRGPSLKFASTTASKMRLRTPAAIRIDDKLHFVAQIDRYDADQCLFYLQPVRTASR